jgi:glycosyltransferase involved in cell wall biosynthesis
MAEIRSAGVREHAPEPERAPSQGAAVDVSVVICAYTERRWDALVEAVESIAAQRPGALEAILVIDHNPALLARAHAELPGVTVIANTGPRVLSGARNTGVAVARGALVAFLDDDALAHPGWLAALTEPFEDPAILGTGGIAAPAWESARPAWMPEEFLWVVGCSYRGLPEQPAEIRNPIGANMAFRRDVLLASGGFTDGIGRIGRTPLGCEETELSVRARKLTGGRVLHLPASGVSHRVTPERATWRYFRRRCWAEGLSKAMVRASVGADAALASERGYVLRTLPTGIWRGLRASFRGELAGLARAVAIVAGLTITTAGFLYGIARDRIGGRP